MTKGILGREENFSDFLYGSFLGCLVRCIFLMEKGKNELIFLDRDNFNFLCAGYECKIPLSHRNENLQRVESCRCLNAPLNKIVAFSLDQFFPSISRRANCP